MSGREVFDDRLEHLAADHQPVREQQGKPGPRSMKAKRGPANFPGETPLYSNPDRMTSTDEIAGL